MVRAVVIRAKPGGEELLRIGPRHLLGLVVLVVAAWIAGRVPLAMPAPRWGFNDVWDPNLKAELSWMRGLGANIIRFPNSRNASEATGNLAGDILPRCGADIQPIHVAFSWGGGPDGPPGLNEFGDYWGQLATRFQNQCHYQPWNEPNLNPPWASSPDGCLSIGDCVRLYVIAAEAIHRTAPDARILGPPIAPVNAAIEPMTWQQYQHDVYRELPNYVHCAVHLYPRQKEGDARLREIADHFDGAAELGRPVHVTELDMAAPWIHTDSTQPRLAGKAFDLLAKKKARSIIFHSIEDHRAEAEEISKAARRAG